jgi:hypothetical protein
MFIFKKNNAIKKRNKKKEKAILLMHIISQVHSGVYSL